LQFRSYLSFVVALAVHGGALAALAGGRVPPSPTEARAPDEIAIEVVTVPETPTTSPIAPLGGRHESPVAGSGFGGRVPPAMGATGPAGRPRSALGASEVTEEAMRAVPSLLARPPEEEPAIAAIAAPAPAATGEAPRPDPGGLRLGMSTADIAAGRGAGGTITREAVEVTRASRAPVFGEARFEALMSPAGIVFSVKTIAASSERSTWDEIATSLVQALGKRHLAVSFTGRGALITFRVRSRTALPAGHDPEIVVSLSGLPTSIPKGDHPAHVDLSLLPTPTVVNFATDLDPTEVRASISREVTAQVLEERAL
jgi:hypothetical protein